MDLKEKLAGLRIRQGLSQGEFASKVNVSRQTVYKWEHGGAVPSAKNLAAISRLFDVPVDELVNGGPPVAVAEEPEATPPEAVEEPEAPPCKRAGILKIWGAIGAVALALLVAMASVITIWSAIFKEPEKPENGIIRTEDMEPDYIDPAEVQDWTDTTITIEP